MRQSIYHLEYCPGTADKVLNIPGKLKQAPCYSVHELKVQNNICLHFIHNGPFVFMQIMGIWKAWNSANLWDEIVMFILFIVLPSFFLLSVCLNSGLSSILSLTLSILSETVAWVGCESRASHYSKCHSKLITSVSCLAIHPSCSDLEKIDRKVTSE